MYIAILGSLATSVKQVEDQETGIESFCLYKTMCSTKADTQDKHNFQKCVCVDNSFIM